MAPKFQPSKYSRYNPNTARMNTSTTSSSAMSYAWTAYAITGIIAWPFAVAYSYKRNQSIPWAFLSGMVPIPYVIYYKMTEK